MQIGKHFWGPFRPSQSFHPRLGGNEDPFLNYFSSSMATFMPWIWKKILPWPLPLRKKFTNKTWKLNRKSEIFTALVSEDIKQDRPSSRCSVLCFFFRGYLCELLNDAIKSHRINWILSWARRREKSLKYQSAQAERNRSRKRIRKTIYYESVEMKMIPLTVATSLSSAGDRTRKIANWRAF